jgi:hypothetical protein
LFDDDSNTLLVGIGTLTSSKSLALSDPAVLITHDGRALEAAQGL